MVFAGAIHTMTILNAVWGRCYRHLATLHACNGNAGGHALNVGFRADASDICSGIAGGGKRWLHAATSFESCLSVAEGPERTAMPRDRQLMLACSTCRARSEKSLAPGRHPLRRPRPTGTGLELAVAFFESCRSVAALSGAHSDDRFPRLSPFIAMPANDR
jgi:hypothetical protein